MSNGSTMSHNSNYWRVTMKTINVMFKSNAMFNVLGIVENINYLMSLVETRATARAAVDATDNGVQIAVARMRRMQVAKAAKSNKDVHVAVERMFDLLMWCANVSIEANVSVDSTNDVEAADAFVKQAMSNEIRRLLSDNFFPNGKPAIIAPAFIADLNDDEKFSVSLHLQQ